MNTKILVFAVMAMLMTSFAFAAMDNVANNVPVKNIIDGGNAPVVDDADVVDSDEAKLAKMEREQLRTATQAQTGDSETAPVKEQIREKLMERVHIGEKEMNSDMAIKTDAEGKIKATLSNGRDATVKIMPATASENALRALRLHNCVEAEGCTIELKEVGQGNESEAAYEVKTQKEAKLFGLFKTKMQVQAQISAENGEVIKTKKAWWAFLASEEDVTEEVEVETETPESEAPADAINPTTEPIAEEVVA